MTVEELREWLAAGRPVTVLDVRSAAAREEWSIPGSFHADVQAALQSDDPGPLSRVPLPRNGPVVTVCNRGNSSRIAARQLRSRGVDAVSLAGGMQAWSLSWNTAEVPLAGSLTRILQIRRTGKGCLSYVLAARGEACVIDASVDPEVYLDVVAEARCRITIVLDTHVHADHLSRSRRLADRTGATLRLPAQNRVHFAFDAVEDGDVLLVGGARLRALRVPGHTFESTAFLLEEGAGALFTGDTLFLNGVGRPDLEATPAETRERARALHASLRRIFSLPESTLVLPAHTSHPVAFDREPLVATLAEVRARVPLAAAAEEEFVTEVLARIPPTPPNHHVIVEHNEAGSFPDGEPTELEAGANRCAVQG